MFHHLLTPPRSSTLLLRAWQNKRLGIFTRLAQPHIHDFPLRQASTAVNEPLASVSPLDVKIPYLSQLNPQPLVQIPYVPDFWNSSSPSIEPISKETLPKLLVVAGAGTHHGGGPSHNLLDISSEIENDSLGSITASSPSRRLEEKGLWEDMADDIGLSPPKNVKNTIQKLFSLT